MRPTGLGDESGAGGGTGLIAIAGIFALLATTKRKRWILVLLAFGAMAAIATGLGTDRAGRRSAGGGGLSAAHQQRWSGAQKAATLAARDAGGGTSIRVRVRLGTRRRVFSRYSSLHQRRQLERQLQGRRGAAGSPSLVKAVAVRLRSRDGGRGRRLRRAEPPNSTKATTSTPRRPTTSSSRKSGCRG